MISNKQWIDSKVAGFLLSEDKSCYSLLAVYATLLKYRTEGHYYSPKNELKGYKLLSQQTCISENTLRKNIPTLIGMGLCYFSNNGGFFLVGRNKVNQLFENTTKKMVPVYIGNTFCETKGNVKLILIRTNLKRQEKAYRKKATLHKVKEATEKGIRVSNAEYNLYKKSNVDFNNLNKVENTVLSNNGFSKILGENKSESFGKYWKNTLEKRGFISTRRRYRRINNKKLSYSEYKTIKNQLISSYGVFIGYLNGYLVEYICSEVVIAS